MLPLMKEKYVEKFLVDWEYVEKFLVDWEYVEKFLVDQEYVEKLLVDWIELVMIRTNWKRNCQQDLRAARQSSLIRQYHVYQNDT